MIKIILKDYPDLVPGKVYPVGYDPRNSKDGEELYNLRHYIIEEEILQQAREQGKPISFKFWDKTFTIDSIVTGSIELFRVAEGKKRFRRKSQKGLLIPMLAPTTN